MKITEVRVYGKLLPMASSYNMSSAAVGEPDTTIVELVTDTAYVGWVRSVRRDRYLNPTMPEASVLISFCWAQHWSVLIRVDSVWFTMQWLRQWMEATAPSLPSTLLVGI